MLEPQRMIIHGGEESVSYKQFPHASVNLHILLTYQDERPKAVVARRLRFPVVFAYYSGVLANVLPAVLHYCS